MKIRTAAAGAGNEKEGARLTAHFHPALVWIQSPDYQLFHIGGAWLFKLPPWPSAFDRRANVLRIAANPKEGASEKKHEKGPEPCEVINVCLRANVRACAQSHPQVSVI